MYRVCVERLCRISTCASLGQSIALESLLASLEAGMTEDAAIGAAALAVLGAIYAICNQHMSQIGGDMGMRVRSCLQA